MKFQQSHLAYCTNIHPAENWEETRQMLATHVLAVRDLLRQQGRLKAEAPFAIGLRLSAVAAEELLQGNHLAQFKAWLEETNTYVFTINGFPYGSFHGTRVKEKVFQPDWTDPARIEYTKNLFRILAEIAKPEAGGSVSTLPGSHKTFSADESVIRQNLIDFSIWLEELTKETGIDLHLGLEPEPIGYIENTAETLAFFERLHDHPKTQVHSVAASASTTTPVTSPSNSTTPPPRSTPCRKPASASLKSTSQALPPSTRAMRKL